MSNADDLLKGVRAGSEIGDPILKAMIFKGQLAQQEQENNKNRSLEEQRLQLEAQRYNDAKVLDYIKTISGGDPNAFATNYQNAFGNKTGGNIPVSSDRTYQDQRADQSIQNKAISQRLMQADRGLDLQAQGQSNAYNLGNTGNELQMAKLIGTGAITPSQPKPQQFSPDAEAKVKDGKIEFSGSPTDLMQLGQNPQTAPLIQQALKNTFQQEQPQGGTNTLQDVASNAQNVTPIPQVPQDFGQIQTPSTSTPKTQTVSIGGRSFDVVLPSTNSSNPYERLTQTQLNRYKELGIGSEAGKNYLLSLGVDPQVGSKSGLSEEETKPIQTNTGTKIGIINQIDSTVASMNDPKIDEATKVRLGNQLLKVLNSTEGKDAVGAEEAERLGDTLVYHLGLNPVNLFDPTKKFIGRNLPGFIDQATQTSNNLKTAVNSNRKSIGRDAIYNNEPVSSKSASSYINSALGQ